MKEFESDKNVKEKTELSVEKEQKQKDNFVGTIVPYPGHTLFEVDIYTGEITEAEYEQQDLVLGKDWKKESAKKGKVIMKKDKIYISALNKKNCAKKALKRQNGSKFDQSQIFLKM